MFPCSFIGMPDVQDLRLMTIRIKRTIFFALSFWFTFSFAHSFGRFLFKILMAQ